MTGPNALPQGTLVRLLFRRCQCDPSWLRQPALTRDAIRNAVRAAGLLDMAETSYAFENGGYTTAVILAESHLVVHTWPESGRLVMIDISVCDYSQPNRERALDLSDRLAVLFQPQEIVREILPLCPRAPESVEVDCLSAGK
ncbi:MAG TPA: S-adenosylmethionine decarboxylase [bacterium]|nr:S-adenosylmethionine decarboxylase [bacterium]HXK94166.1 S-adenosylmethionine decarboxylase [bacterium]